VDLGELKEALVQSYLSGGANVPVVKYGDTSKKIPQMAVSYSLPQSTDDVI